METALDTQETAFAWRVHAALEAWGVRVDRKAGVLLAHQGGGFVLGVTALTDRWSPMIAVGLGLLLLAMCTAAAVVLPVLGSTRRLAREGATNLIYFGHLRTWHAAALAAELGRVGAHAEIIMLARQLITLSRLNWRKHRLLQLSVVVTLSAMCIGAAAVLAKHGN